MATIRARFVLEDHASTTMANIARKAEGLDRVLQGLDQRLETLDRTQDDLATNWERRSARMSRTFREDVNAMRGELTSLNTFMGGFDRKKTLRVDADVTRAAVKIRALRAMAEGTATMGVNSRGGGASRVMGMAGGGGIAGLLGGVANRRQGTNLGSLFGRMAGGVERFGGALDRVGVNIGPLSSRLSTLPLLLGALAPPVLGGIATGVSVLTGSIAALGAAAIGAASMLGAFTFGIAAIAVPAVLAGKALGEKNKEIDKAKKKLDAANTALNRANKYTKDGKAVTDTYRNALRRKTDAQNAYNEALKKVSKNERKLLDNVRDLKKEWNDRVMNGPSGQRAIGMMSGGVEFATTQMPFLASMMDKFTLRGQRLFNMANRNAPRFRRQMMMATDEWPARFEEGGKSFGHFASGLLGVLRAAEPFTKWMSEGILDASERFDKWANGSKGQLALRGFFNDMKPILSELTGLVGDFGKAFVDLARGDADDTVYFLGEIREFVREMPDFIDKWTDRFRRMWPTIEDILRDMSDMADYVWEGFSDIEGVLDGLADPLGKVHGWIKKIGAVMPEGLGVLLLGTMAVKPGRALVFNSVAKGITGIATALGKIPVTKTKTLSGLLRNIPGLNKLPKAGKVGGGAASVLGMFEAGLPVTVVGNSPINPLYVAVINGGIPGLGRTPKAGPPINPGRGGGGRGVPRGGNINPRTGRPYAPGTEPIPGGKAAEGARATPGGRVVYPESVPGARPIGGRGGMRGGGGGVGAGGAMAVFVIADATGWKGIIPGLMGDGFFKTDKDRKKEEERWREEQSKLPGVLQDPSFRDAYGEYGWWKSLDKERADYDKAASSGGKAGDAYEQAFRGIQGGLMGGQNGAASDFFKKFAFGGNKEVIDIQDYIRTEGAVKIAQDVDRATREAMQKGRSNLTVGGVQMVLAYNEKMDQIEVRRIDLSGFFGDMWSKFRSGVGALGGIVKSVQGPLESFWDTLTGGGGSDPAPAGGGMRARVAPNSQNVANPAGGSRSKPREGDSMDGLGGLVSDPLGAIGGWLGSGADAIVEKAIGWLSGKGTAGARTADGLRNMYAAVRERISSMFSSGGAASSTGLVPAAQRLLQFLSSEFGVHLTSGFRPGSITESGNVSLHSVGRAIDVGGTAAQMRAVWNYMLGKGGIDEMIYAGQIAENGGPPGPYSGADKHYDHVHIGIGDSRKGTGKKARPSSGTADAVAGNFTLSMAGANIHIHNESDYEKFVERLAGDIERAVASAGTSAGGMIDDDE